MPKHLILCDCSGTQNLDKEALSQATGLPCSKVHSALCTTQIEQAATALEGEDAIICCAQEHRFFDALAEELGRPSPAYLDLRDRAGWTTDQASTLPKMSALVAEALLEIPTSKTVDVHSEGLCLILGAPDVAFAAAEKLQDTHAVTVLLEQPIDPPMTRAYDVISGHLRRAQGGLGQFAVTIDQLQQLDVTGRNWTWDAPRDGGQSICDIILDLRGDRPLFPAPEKREGYVRADPKSPTALADAILTTSQLIGTFEKPLYVRSEPLLCAHSRAGQTGCTRCLDVCPTGAISPDGDHVSIDPMICAGCGSAPRCAPLAPSPMTPRQPTPRCAGSRRWQRPIWTQAAPLRACWSWMPTGAR